MIPTDKMIEAALAALNGKSIDGRQFWTEDDRFLMRKAIQAAIEADPAIHSAVADALSYADLRASGGLVGAP